MANNNSSSLASLKFNVMIMRIAFLIAFLLGLGSLFNVFHFTATTLDVHIAAGIIVAIVMWFLAITLSRTKQRGSGAMWAAAILIVIGGFIGLFFSVKSNALGITHMVIMIIAMGLAEMGSSLAKKTS